ncbi:hypothetical protein DKM44_02215 [Deinococcus irradiatisoli]|uniref:Uncharacterized protein n=1 Tax=Deinococcus irradiatisoli TaxID=2202254 RepID=A0A2Z3JAQ4_9DEIO|nr:hypothetical protein [Deinococcus irradiatisoli]AWN22193.1 hypothetical protein DKM44_02215 [Deinococcus irradiatisoli]
MSPSAQLLAEIDNLILCERTQLQSESSGEVGEMPQEEYEHEWMVRISLADLVALRAGINPPIRAPQAAPDALREVAEAYRAAHALRAQAQTARREAEARFIGLPTPYPEEDVQALTLALNAEQVAMGQLHAAGRALVQAALGEVQL